MGGRWIRQGERDLKIKTARNDSALFLIRLVRYSIKHHLEGKESTDDTEDEEESGRRVGVVW